VWENYRFVAKAHRFVAEVVVVGLVSGLLCCLVLLGIGYVICGTGGGYVIYGVGGD
jgi:hypothetical protein